MTETEKNELEEKKDLFNDQIEDINTLIIENEKQFESKITYLGSGAIALVLAFADKHQHYMHILIPGICLVGLSVFLNLYSQLWIKRKLRKEQDKLIDISDGIAFLLSGKIEEECYIKHKKIIAKNKLEINRYIDSIVVKRNKKGDAFNEISLYILIAGIIITLIYVMLNLNIPISK